MMSETKQLKLIYVLSHILGHSAVASISSLVMKVTFIYIKLNNMF